MYYRTYSLSRSLFYVVQSTLFKSCFAGSNQRSNGKTPFFSFFKLPNIWSSCDENSLNSIHSFDVLVAPSWKGIFIVKWQSYIPLNFKGYCKKSMGFHQRWLPRDIAFVKSELVYYLLKKNRLSVIRKCKSNSISGINFINFIDSRIEFLILIKCFYAIKKSNFFLISGFSNY